MSYRTGKPGMALLDDEGRLVGFRQEDGTEQLLPRLTEDGTGLVGPDGEELEIGTAEFNDLATAGNGDYVALGVLSDGAGSSDAILRDSAGEALTELAMVVANRTGDLADLLADAGVDGQISVAQDKGTLVLHNGVEGEAVPMLYTETTPSGGTVLVGPDGVIDVSHRLAHAGQLKKWRKALAAVQSGAANAKLMFLGDSTTAGAMATGVSWANNRPLTIANAIARRLSGAGVNANVGSTLGPGVINTANFLLYDTRWTLGAEWVANSLPGLGGGYIVSLPTGATAANFTPTAPDGTALSFDRIEIVYLKNSAYANFTVGVDGGAAAFTSTQAGGGAIDRVTVSVAAGTHTVNIQKVGGDSAKHLHVQSVICYSSTAPAVLCLTAGYGGGLAADMANAAAYYSAKNALIYQAPDLTVINLTINDAIAQTSVSAYTASLQAIITAAKLSGDVILMGGNAIDDTFSGFVLGTDAAYYQACEELAATNDVPYLSIVDLLGTYVTANADGFMGDGAHPNRYGYQEIANMLYPYLML